MKKIAGYLLLCLLLMPQGLHAQKDKLPGVTEADILPYLEEVLAWQRKLGTIEQEPGSPREALLETSAQKSAKKVRKEAFYFARMQSDMFAAEHNQAKPESAEPAEVDKTSPAARRMRLKQRATEVDRRVVELRTQLDQVTTGLRKASGKRRQSMSLQQETLRGKIKLANAQQQVLQSMLAIYTEGEEKNLSGKIDDLHRAVMEEEKAKQLAAKAAETEKDADTAKERKGASEGMLKLSSTLLFYSRNQKEIEQLIADTETLREYTRKLSASLRATLKESLNQGNALAESLTTVDPKQLPELRKGVDAMAARYTQLAVSLPPLGQTGMQLEATANTLEEWRGLIQKDWDRVLHQLLFRILVLAVAIAVPLVFSSLAERAIQRYAPEARRRRQLNLVRRTVLIFVLGIIILMNFISEFGSLVTFAGFLTAGLAVALQTVLVSLVAHFFFFGRYGVRAGDRVTIGEVTGDVLHVGMMRIYIRKLDATHPDMPPSGQIVAFPNSILFQPSGFYKHVEER